MSSLKKTTTHTPNNLSTTGLEVYVPVVARIEKWYQPTVWYHLLRTLFAFIPKGDVQSQAAVRAIARQVCEQLIQSE